MNDTNMNGSEDRLYDVFTVAEVNRLHDEYKTHLNPSKSLYQIASQIFRHYNVRTIDDISDSNIASHAMRDDIQTAFLNIQSLVVTTDKEKKELVEHKRGDFIRDANGDPIPTDDGKDYKKYTKDTFEKVSKLVEVPYFDYQHGNSSALRELERRLMGYEVLPDYEELRRKFESPTKINYLRGLEIIRKLTQYYIFDEPEEFVERFALLICNAKAKALGYQPKYPVLFSLVGKMGVGKSWLAQMVKDTHDKCFCCRSGVTSYGRLLGGQFNAMMLTRGFLSIDEAQGLDKAQWDKLKTYISSTTVDIERKGRDVKTCDNLVTFFSTTNDSVLNSVVNYSEDRRIVEFVIKEKREEIPEKDIVEWLEELWLVMPVVHPHAQEIKDSLLATSNIVLNAKMEEVVYDLFKEHPEIVGAKNLNRHKFKAAIRTMGGIPHARVSDWCMEHGILKRAPSGHIRVSKRTLEDFMDNYSKECDNGGSKAMRDIDELFKVEGI